MLAAVFAFCYLVYMTSKHLTEVVLDS